MKLPSFIGSPDPSIFLSDNFLVLDVETTNNQFGWAVAPNELLYTYIHGPLLAPQGIEVIGGVLELSKYVDMLLEADFIVAHNLKMELGWLHRAGMDISRVLGYDTMLGDYCLAGNRRWKLSLEEMSKRYGGPDKGAYINTLMKNGVCPSEMPASMLYDRCKLDVAMTENIFLKQRQLLKNQGLLPVQYTKCLFTPVVADMEINGMYLDAPLVKKIHKELTEEHVGLITELDKLTGGINMASPKQVGEFLYDKLHFKEITRHGIPCKTPAGSRLTNSETIEKLVATTAKQRSFLGLKQRESKIRKKISTYTSLFVKNIEENKGHLHGRINQCVTGTHRTSSSGPNLQNIDRTLKKVFTARNKNSKIMAADYSQLEYRVAGFLAQCPVVLNDIKEGVDAHVITAEIIYGKSFKEAKGKKRSDIRTDAKSRCFPTYTEILTPTGWKKHNEIRVGDEVIDYDPVKKCLAKDTVLECIEPYEDEIWRMQTKHNWKVDSTAGHRWYCTKRTDHGSGGRTYDPLVVFTKDIHTGHRIITSAFYTRGRGVLTPEEAALVGWIESDGTRKMSPKSNAPSTSFGKRRGISCIIVQKKQKGIDAIKKLLPGLQPKLYNTNGCYRWLLPARLSRSLYRTVDWDNIDWEKFVLSLSVPARKAFLEAIFLAEGTTRNNGEWRIAQNSGGFCRGIKLAGYLEGYDIRVVKILSRTNKWHEQITLRTRPYVTGQRITKESLGRMPVWCVRTANGTVVIRQGETISISGNTFKPLYGGQSGTKKEKEYYSYFLEKHTGIKKWHNKLCEEGIKYQSIRTITGLTFYFPGTKYTDNGYLQNQTNIKNYPVQYFATGEIAIIGATLLWHQLRARGLKTLLVNEVHDSVILEVPDEEVELVEKIAQNEMVESTIKYLDKVYSIDYNYNMDVEIKTARNWE